MAKKAKENPAVVEETRVADEVIEAAHLLGIPVDIYCNLLKEDPKESRYLYYDVDTHEYFQDDKYISNSDEVRKTLNNYRIIDLKSEYKDGIVTWRL